MSTGISGSIGSIIPSYTGNPRVGGRRCNALAVMLAKVAPPGLSEAQQRKLREVQERAGDVDDVISARERISAGRLQGPRLELTNAWSACHEALQAGARLPQHLGNHGDRCGAILGTLLPEGVAFTKLDAVELWGHSRRLLERIREEGLHMEIGSLLGPPYLQAVEAATATLGDAVGVGSGQPAPSRTALAQAVQRFSGAVGAYTRSLAADVDESDEASIKRFLSAVSPIDEHRSKHGDDEDETTVESVTRAPIPPVEAPPAAA